jgi:hypothetical protein
VNTFPPDARAASPGVDRSRMSRREHVRLARLRVEVLLDRCGWRWDATASKLLDQLLILAEEEDAS